MTPENARIEAEPAKNPSFWTSKSLVQHLYCKVGDFWLPAENRSTSHIRLGGQATLTIQYLDYTLTDGSQPATRARTGHPVPAIDGQNYPGRTLLCALNIELESVAWWLKL